MELSILEMKALVEWANEYQTDMERRFSRTSQEYTSACLLYSKIKSIYDDFCKNLINKI